MSFTQGLSGLSAASSDLEVIGNNVANANTVGFKASQAQFGDLFAAALSGAGTAQIGLGTKLETVAQQFTQGNISTTGNSLDMAINGPGFFTLDTGFGTAYSRNGQFQLDKNGFIVSSAGYKLKGYSIDPTTGKPLGSPTALNIPTAVSAAAATGASTGVGEKGVVVGMNLDSRSLPPVLPGNVFNPNDPNTFNYSTPITTYDSKGVAQNTTMYFVKNSTFLPNASTSMVTAAGTTTVTCAASATLAVGQAVEGAGFPTGTTITAVFPAGAGPYTSFTTSANPSPVPALATAADITVDRPNSWQVYTTVTNPTTGATIFPSPVPAAGAWVANGILSFGTNGRFPPAGGFTPNPNAPSAAAAAAAALLGNWEPNNTTTNISFTPGGADPETIPFDFSASTQFGATFSVTTSSQDGFTAGQLSGFTIGSDGTILGKYSNNTTKALGQVVLTTFPDMQGLQPLGNNTWGQTGASGSPVTNAPGVGTNGVIQTGATEDSSTNLTAELVNMMTAQRNYQANAQTVKTQDTVMQTLINMR